AGFVDMAELAIVKRCRHRADPLTSHPDFELRDADVRSGHQCGPDRRPTGAGRGWARMRRCQRLTWLRFASALLGHVVCHLVDRHRDREDQRVALRLGDVDPVSVARPEPALRHLGDLLAPALDLVLVVDDVAIRLHVLATLDLDREALAKRRYERLLDRPERLATALDLHRVAEAQ